MLFIGGRRGRSRTRVPDPVEAPTDLPVAVENGIGSGLVSFNGVQGVLQSTPRSAEAVISRMFGFEPAKTRFIRGTYRYGRSYGETDFYEWDVVVFCVIGRSTHTYYRTDFTRADRILVCEGTSIRPGEVSPAS